jgi:hypothetical protein
MALVPRWEDPLSKIQNTRLADFSKRILGGVINEYRAAPPSRKISCSHPPNRVLAPYRIEAQDDGDGFKF